MKDLREQVLPRARPFTYAALCAVASRHGVGRAIQRGEIVRVLPDLYASAVHADSWAVRARAAIAWAGPQTYAVPFGWWQGDVPAAMPEYAVVQAYGRASPDARAEIVYSAFRSRAVSAASIGRALARMPRVRARAGLEARVAYAADGVESYLEERGLRHVLTGASFQHLLRQHRVFVEGKRFRVDVYDPETSTAFELDGAGAHASFEQRRADVERDALLAGVGIQTVRFTYRDVIDRPKWCRGVALRVMTDRGGARAIRLAEGA